MKQHIHRCWNNGGIFLLCLAAISPTHAQIVPDATLPVNSAVTSADNVSTITGGTVAGRNLFHSFEQFNIDELQRADFISPSAAIQNILARVTGSSGSKILGVLSTSGLSNPNLFLINPNGIVFGPKSRLEVGGSFVATTANAIQFNNQGFFSASAPNDPGLLTVNPSAFFFNQIATKSIENNSIAPAGFNQSGLELIGLRVPNDRSLLLIGGNVTLNNGQLHALGGRVELGGVASSGTVGLNFEDNDLLLSYPSGVQRASVSLTNGARVDVTARGGGSIAINARNLNVLQGSVLQGGIGEDLESDGTQAGDIVLAATNVMKIAGSRIANNVESGAVGNAGSIVITAGSLSLTDSAELSASTFGQGEAGGISVQADGSVSIAGSFITTGQNEEMGVVGNAGDINIQTGSLSLSDGTQLGTSTSGEGVAGNVIIDAQNTVSLENSFISSETFGSGNAGNINIKANELSLSNGAVLLSATFGEGKAGNIQINASDSISIFGVSLEDGFSSGLVTSTEEEESGQGGDISVSTSILSISDGAVLSARTRSTSPGGNITVNVNTLEAMNGGQLLTTAFSSGNAGDITVNATNNVTLSGSDPTFADRLAQFGRPTVDPAGSASGLFANTSETSTGQGGDLKIATGQLIVQDGAQVTASSQGTGDAGNILNITARSLKLDNGSISTTSRSGQGGNIDRLQVQDLLLLRNHSQISTTAGTDQNGDGNGGNITINTPFIVAVPSENSDITANAYTGKGGNIQITASGLFGIQRQERDTPTSDITASSQFGINGVVNINTPDVDPSRGLATLPAQLVEASGLIATGCAALGENEFIITGRGGIPPNPSDPLSNDTVWTDLRPLTQLSETRPSSESATQETNPATEQLVEAQGWVINNLGEVVLTAHAPNVTPHIPWLAPAQCHAPKTSS